MQLLNFRPSLLIVSLAVLPIGVTDSVLGDEPKILQVSSEEAIASDYSHQRAVDFLDRTSMAWTQKYKCFTCHTNFAHLIAVSELEQRPEYFEKVRSSLNELVQERWREKGPRWDAEVTHYGSFVSKAQRFDHNAFGASAQEAFAMDPQHRLLLEVCRVFSLLSNQSRSQS